MRHQNHCLGPHPLMVFLAVAESAWTIETYESSDPYCVEKMESTTSLRSSLHVCCGEQVAVEISHEERTTRHLHDASDA